jgi:group I intron endonuclease
MAEEKIPQSGIYAIRHDASGKLYVGSAVNLKRRFKDHRVRLVRGDHHAQKLQRSWDKYGENAFSFILLEACEPADLLLREQYWMDVTESASERGFNSCPTAGNILGIKRSAETRAKMSAWQVGRKMGPMSAEQRAKRSAANKGIQKSAEWIQKLSASQKGKHVSAETRAKISAAVRGFRHTAEAKAKIGAASRSRIRKKKVRSADAQLTLALDGA